jgi:NTE family protein
MSKHPATRRQIGLALSGGGARCYAHIGALAALEEEGLLRPCAIAANSSAAVLAALYAAGHDARAVEAIVRGIDFSDFLEPASGGGLIHDDPVEGVLERHAPETFEELAVPLAVPAVDIERGELLIYSSGPLRPRSAPATPSRVCSHRFVSRAGSCSTGASSTTSRSTWCGP